MIDLAEDLRRPNASKVKDQNVYAIVEEGERIPALGIEFDLKPTDHKLVTKSLLSSVRRLHINCGHPPSEDLA